MNSNGPLIFSLTNFAVLVYILLRILGRTARQFFFRRRMVINKAMVESVVMLKVARERAAKSKDSYEGLPEDMEARKAAIASGTARDCAIITAEAQQKADHIIDGARRLAMEEQLKAARVVRERLLEGAFALARQELERMADSGISAAAAERGLSELSRALRAG